MPEVRRKSKRSSKKRKRSDSSHKDKSRKKRRSLSSKSSTSNANTTSLSTGFKKCLQLLTKIMQSPLADDFLYPVDWKLWELWDYPDVVEHAMDLGTVRTHLVEDRFVNMEHFADNVRLVFENAMSYNPVGTSIHEFARSLLYLFNAKFEEIDLWMYKSKKPEPIDFLSTDFMDPEDLDPDVVKCKEDIEEIKSEIQSKKDSISVIEGKADVPKHINIDILPPVPPFSEEERDELADKFLKLSEEDIEGIMDIITVDDTDDELELDFETMDDYSFSKVKAYVYECLLRNGEGLDPINRLEIAEQKTSVRIQFLERQLKGISLSKNLSVGMTVAVKPPAETKEEDVFCIAKISELPKTAEVNIQWFELSEIINEDERYYKLGAKTETISVLSVYYQVSVYLQKESEAKLFKLTDYKRTRKECLITGLEE